MGRKPEPASLAGSAAAKPERNGVERAAKEKEPIVDFKANRELMRRLFADDLERAQEAFYRKHPDLRPTR